MDMSPGDAGFEAALKALDALDEPAVSTAPAPVPVPQAAPAAPIAVAPALSIDMADAAEPLAEMVSEAPPVPLKLAPAEAEAVAEPHSSGDHDLEDAVSASMASISISAAEPVPAAGHASEVIPAAKPAVAMKPRRAWLVATSIAALGVFASLTSMVGLVVASRTVAGASLVVADARERQQQLVKIGALAHDLEIIRTKQLELLARQQAAAGTTPLSSEQFYKTMDNLRSDIGQRGPDVTVMHAIREGDVDTQRRIDELTLKVMRIESAVSGRRVQ